MKDWSKKLIRIIIGLFLFAMGNVLTINAGLGVAPWVVFDQGISNLIGTTIGQANILVGIIIFIIAMLLGQPIGWGSILNMLLIGTFMDILMLNNLIPIFNIMSLKIIALLIGIIFQGLATYYYLGGGLGAGPRDGLMVVLTLRTKKSFRLVKTSLEILVVSIGYVLGGDLGFGTVIMALFAGHIFQVVFNIVKFDVSGVSHRPITDDILYFKERWAEKKVEEEDPLQDEAEDQEDMEDFLYVEDIDKHR